MEKGIFNNFYQYLTDYFENGYLKAADNEPAFLIQKRAAAFQVFKQKGLPSNREEDWKYTNLNRLLKDDFKIQNTDSLSKKVSVDIEGLDACRVVLINGRFAPELSHGLPEGVTFLDTKAVFDNSKFADKIGSIAPVEDNSILALNTAFFGDCSILHIAAKSVISVPIHVTHIYTDYPDAAFIPYRMLVFAEKLSEATLIETFHSSAENPVFVNYVSEQQVDEAAVFHSHMINALGENVHFIHHREVLQFKNSVLNNSNLSLGKAPLTRNNMNFRLKEQGTETNLLGTYIVSGKQHVDNHTIVDHQSPNCNSSELYKGILLDKARGVFSGKIFVRPDAQKTNAFQQNNNLLLSDQATVNSKPQLEIFADDVKCSHGSTVGQMNKDALFYLKTRGIGEESASRLLVEAFAHDVHSQINIQALREYASNLLQEKLQSEILIIA
jgi:Fe-S cluster assembly protein SufD